MKQLLQRKYLIRFKKKNQVGVILMRKIIERVENIVQKKLGIMHRQQNKIVDIDEVRL